MTPPLKETKWKLTQKPLHSNGVLHLVPATRRTQLCFQIFKNLFFSLFALKELEPGIPACPGKLHAKASAGAERQSSPGHGHGPAALKVRRSSAPFPISTFPSHTPHPQIALSAARSSRLRSHSLGNSLEQPVFSCYRHFLFQAAAATPGRAGSGPRKGELGWVRALTGESRGIFRLCLSHLFAGGGTRVRWGLRERRFCLGCLSIPVFIVWNRRIME